MKNIDTNIFKIETKIGTGPGGQHKNRTYSCAVVTHIFSGLSEKCEDTRSKNKNIEIAYKRLQKRLQAIEDDKKHEKLNVARIKAIKHNGIIRTYNFKQNIVKDHRTGETADLKKFLNGNIEILNK